MIYITQLRENRQPGNRKKKTIPSMTSRSILYRELDTKGFVPMPQRCDIKEGIMIVRKAWSIPA